MSSSTLDRTLFKQLRKGTKSCQECRRRKVKCNFTDDGDITCELCKKFHRPCLKQSYRVNQNLKARIIKAESAVERLARAGNVTSGKNTTSQGFGHGEPQKTCQTSSNRASNDSADTSFLKLFNTTPFSNRQRNKLPSAQLQTTVTFNDPTLSDRAKLLSTLADEPHIMGIFQHTSRWWTQWRDPSWAQRAATPAHSLHDFVEAKLADDDVVAVGIGLLCIAMSLFLLRPGIDDGTQLYTATAPRSLLDNVLTVVDAIVLDTDKYLYHKDIMKANLLRGKIYAEDSQARNALGYIQKSLKIMQTTQFGQASQRDISAEDLHSQQQFAGGVFEVDRYMCMVFGFPYVADSNFSDHLAFDVLLQQPDDMGLRMRALRRVAALAAEAITDRSLKQQPACDHSTASTAERLASAQSALPIEWWDPDLVAMWDNTFEAFEVLITQVWFWTTQMFLFLPAVLDDKIQGRELPGSCYSRCLDAARSLIKVFIALRRTPALSIQVCNCDDFMGVLAGTILLVAMMQTSSIEQSPVKSIQAPITFELDIGLVEALQDTFRYRALEQGGGIAKQGLRVLETLLSFFDDAETNQSVSSGQSSRLDERRITTIMLPYFGTVYVQPLERLIKPRVGAQFGVMLPSPPESLPGDNFIDDNVFDSINWADLDQLMFDTELDQEWGIALSQNWSTVS